MTTSSPSKRQKITNEEEIGYAWEEKYKRSWDMLQEDEQGSLASAISHIQQTLLKKQRIKNESEQIQRGIIRHIFIILDLSRSMMELDLKPNRLDHTLSLLDKFIDEFFDQNPLSQIGIICTRDGLAEKLHDLTTNPLDLKSLLKNPDTRIIKGEPSLENALELAMNSLLHVPKHASREIISIYGALTTCDPGDIQETMDKLKSSHIRVSFVSLSAEIRICRSIATETNGNFGVLLDESHYKQLLYLNISPPPLYRAMKSASLIQMGFPLRSVFNSCTLCVCHGKSIQQGYTCPQCSSIVCDIPMDCPICSLSLVSSPFLARSYHHLFPIPVFNELSSSIEPLHCHACLESFQSHHRYQCPCCQNQYCLPCDIYIHQNLHVCPGCPC